MENEIEGRLAEGVPEREPETIGEAIKKQFEEDLAGRNAVVLTKRMAELENIFMQHCSSFN